MTRTENHCTEDIASDAEVRVKAPRLASTQGGPGQPCVNAADFDNCDRLNVVDAHGINVFLFSCGLIPPFPSPFDCGSDPTEVDRAMPTQNPRSRCRG